MYKISDAEIEQMKEEITQAEQAGFFNELFQPMKQPIAKPENRKEQFLKKIEPDMKLTKKFFLVLYGYGLYDTDFLSRALQKLTAAGCTKANFYYQTIVKEYKAQQAVEWKEVAEWYRETRGKGKPKLQAKQIEEQIPQENRTSTMLQLVSGLVAKGFSEEAIKAAVIVENRRKCNPPLSEKELEKEVFSAMQRDSYKMQNGGEEQRNQISQARKQEKERERKKIQLLTEKKRLLNFLKSTKS